MTHFKLSLMEHNDILEAAKVLSIALLHNPLHIAVYGDSGEEGRLAVESGYLELFRTLPGIAFVVKEGSKIVGVTRMRSCVGSGATEDLPELTDEDTVEYRRSVWRREWSERDPKQLHWHLGPIGVLPSHRRLGIGSMLMERFCEEVDRCSTMAYLETDRDVNVLFYRKFGFEIVSESYIVGVLNSFMMREPRT